MTTERMTVVFSKVVDLAEVLGVENIKELEGCWEYRFGDKWLLKMNGHPEEIDGVPAFHCYMERGGFPAAVFNPYGGTTLGGSEDELIAVLDEAIRAARSS